MPFGILEHWSPEHALNNVIVYMREDGVDGLKKHLTAKALKTVEGIQKISDLPEVNIIASSILGDNALSFVLSKLSELDWTINEVMKGSETSKCVLGFKYEYKVSGTIEMTLIKEDGKWKVDKLGIPKFDKFDLPEPEKTQDQQ